MYSFHMNTSNLLCSSPDALSILKTPRCEKVPHPQQIDKITHRIHYLQIIIFFPRNETLKTNIREHPSMWSLLSTCLAEQHSV